MNKIDYLNSYNYKDEIVEKYKQYNPIVHTDKEEDYDFLESENCYSIEIKNGNDSLFIDLEKEISLYYGDWHGHFDYDTRKDYDYAMDTLDKILENKICIISIYSNNEWYSSYLSDEKKNYTKEEAIEYIKNNYNTKKFKKQGVIIKFGFWDKSKNYEYYIENVELK